MRLPLIRRITVSAAAGFIVLYVSLACVRVSYPFELNYIESASAAEVARVLTQRPLYDRPSAAYVPLIYPPLYFYAAAAVANAAVPILTSLRLVSVAASGAIVVLIAVVVWRDTRDAWAAAAASGVFAAAYGLSGGWLDIGRVDSLALALIVAAVALGRPPSRLWRHGAAGVLFALATLTKQTAAVVAIIAVISTLRQDRRAGILQGSACLIAGGTLAVLFEHASSGWFSFYTIRLAGAQHVDLGHGALMMLRQVILPLLPAIALGALAARHRRSAGHSPLVIIAAALMAASLVSASVQGAAGNALLPGLAGAALVVGLSLSTLGESGRERLAAIGYLICLVQLIVLAYDPRPLLPSRADAAAGRGLVRLLAAAPDDVLVHQHTELASLAGKRRFAHGAPAEDLLRWGPADLRDDFEREVREDILSGRFSLIVLDRVEWFDDALARCYEPPAPALADGRALWPVAGYRTRPALLYRRKAQCAF